VPLIPAERVISTYVYLMIVFASCFRMCKGSKSVRHAHEALGEIFEVYLKSTLFINEGR
jgi:hypothetical protein